jgi:hypothetical protein
MGGRWDVVAPVGVVSDSMLVTRRAGSDDGPELGHGFEMSSSRRRGGDVDVDCVRFFSPCVFAASDTAAGGLR